MRGRSLGLVPISLAIILASAAHAAEITMKLPLGLRASAAVVPPDNPLTPEKIALGKQLFWDTRWSRNGTVACVSCHLPRHGWADPRRFSVTFDGKATERRSPTLVNRLFGERQHWTGGRSSLEDQALNARDQDRVLLVQRLEAIPGYREQHRQVFANTAVTAENAAKAIAAYVRTIVSGNAPYDRFLAGDLEALSPAARRGLGHFEGKLHGNGCTRCHRGFNLTDESYHNIGVGMDRETPDLGRYTVTGKPVDRGAFKTPTLRDVARRPPYMHDGSLKTLADVVAFYNRGGHRNPWLSPDIQPLNLTPAQEADLVAFLEALTGEIAPEVGSPPALPR